MLLLSNIKKYFYNKINKIMEGQIKARYKISFLVDKVCDD